MAVTKQGSIKLSSEFDADAFKVFKTTHFNDKSNSQVLMWLLDLGTKYLENPVPNLGTKYLDSVPRFQNPVPNSVPESRNVHSVDSTSKLNDLEYEIEILKDVDNDLKSKINNQVEFNKYVKGELDEIFTELERLSKLHGVKESNS